MKYELADGLVPKLTPVPRRRNGKRFSSLATSRAALSPCCWATCTTLGNVDVWATKRSARMSRHSLTASTPLVSTSLCSPSNWRLSSPVPPCSYPRQLPRSRRCNKLLPMQRIMHGRSRWRVTFCWEFLSHSEKGRLGDGNPKS